MKKTCIKNISVVLAVGVLAAFLFVFGGLFAKKAMVSVAAEGDNPIRVIKVTDENRAEVFATKLSSTTEETYNPEDRRWNGIPHIERTAKGRLWATWYSGGNQEPHDDNYIILAYSDDDGESWVDPFLLIDTLDEKVRPFDPWLYTHTDGKMTMTFYYSKKRWTFTVLNPDASSNEIAWSEPELTNENLMACIQEPVRMSNGDLVVTSQLGSNNPYLYYMVSRDDGKTWTKRSEMKSTSPVKGISEAKPVELSDGTLWVLARIDGNKGVERFVSTDGGYTWSEPEYDLGYPLIGPGSRFNITRLKSGNLLFVTNDSTSSRTALTAFLSTDDGKTWNASLLIDDRAYVTYPEVCEDDDGYIYCIYDQGRNYEKEIRFSVFNEEDIKAGVIRSEKGRSRVLITKDRTFREIVSVDADYGYYREVGLGTTKAEIIATLPTELEAKLDDGSKIKLSGEWKCIGYQSKKAGVYLFSFAPTTPLGTKINDARGILSLRVIVGNEKKGEDSGNKNGGEKGCRSTISFRCAVVGGCLLAFGGGLLRKRKKDERN